MPSLLGQIGQTNHSSQKNREHSCNPAALSKGKAVGKELTHGLECLPENPVTSQAVDKPLPNTTTSTNCSFYFVVLDNRTFYSPHLRELF
jgi:hypothetical protein